MQALSQLLFQHHACLPVTSITLQPWAPNLMFSFTSCLSHDSTKSPSQALCNSVALDIWTRFCAHSLSLPFTRPCVSTDGPAAYPIPVQNIKPLLTVSFTSGDISLMNNYDDLSPTVIRSGLKGTKYTFPHRWDLWASAFWTGACRVLSCTMTSLLEFIDKGTLLSSLLIWASVAASFLSCTLRLPLHLLFSPLEQQHGLLLWSHLSLYSGSSGLYTVVLYPEARRILASLLKNWSLYSRVTVKDLWRF